MLFWLINTLAALFLAILFAGILIPQILLISFRRRLFDEPDERKIHTSLVPRLGGMAFMPVIFFTMALLLGIDISMPGSRVMPAVIDDPTIWSFGFCALLMLYVVGLGDDLIGIRYRAKFVVQIACGCLLIAGGLDVDNAYGLLGINEIPTWLAWPLTLLITVFIVNAINLIDGIDGLASGLTSVMMLTYCIVFFWAGAYEYAIVSAATLGVLIPFFYYNVFGDPQKQRKIFMGDTGSLTIGMMACILSFKMINLGPNTEVNMFVVAFSPLIVPCFDVVRVYAWRLRHHTNPFLPDKNHIHHKLLAAGIPQRMAMVIIVAGATTFTLINIYLSTLININLVLVADFLMWYIGFLFIGRIKKRSRH
ncbi:MAG: undecaprenyl/decaprenyl-phosphate alpha-N-acetylglucosaminyl 1-phosphate transferase [Bacteroidales bacterium]|nr:undecaprenyl/decaprenyl-phosphate alpha-N-acetylglucosaminyl 1-phosphate transferase [Bacteroidales bacterium]